MAEMTIPLQFPGPFFDGGIVRDAFHGTTKIAARAILDEAQGFLIFNDRPREYGVGVYFWEGDYLAGLWWASKRTDRAGTVVIQAEVQLGKTLLVNVIGDQLEKIRSDLSEFEGTAWKTDEVIELIVEELRKAQLIDSVKAVRCAGKQWWGNRYRAEVVILVFDPAKARAIASYTEEDLLKSGEVLTL